ncbi:SMI1/KNR4 family protein [Agrobacterium larrymoorei]|uniref:SMI1/KNR4 family protein n=1 Tax=Agrobacterium larrymoorei TaxID=160699 RepID=A0AAF0KDW0_9HYPH|nr:SMI1/KNR4 family protein [Agrobacterium larrymoorei]WHA41650.1 SMI1/KNR4 family protein [Agrobacterium larrymoorei]
MSGLSSFEDALEILDANISQADFFGPASEDDLLKSSKMIGLKFPPSYEAFLKHLGVGAFSDAEFYGIIATKVPGTSVASMTWRTLDDRETAGLPHHLIHIMSSGYGPLFCLDASRRSNDGEYAVVSWSPSNNENNPPKLIADSFGDFFFNEIKTRI